MSDPTGLWTLLQALRSAGQSPQQTFSGGLPPILGMLTPGNINLDNRPVVRNQDGTISTVRSISFGTPHGEVLVPTVSDDGRIMSDNEAIKHYYITGRHLGIFRDPQSATVYAQQLHQDQAAKYR